MQQLCNAFYNFLLPANMETRCLWLLSIPLSDLCILSNILPVYPTDSYVCSRYQRVLDMTALYSMPNMDKLAHCGSFTLHPIWVVRRYLVKLCSSEAAPSEDIACL